MLTSHSAAGSNSEQVCLAASKATVKSADPVDAAISVAQLAAVSAVSLTYLKACKMKAKNHNVEFMIIITIIEVTAQWHQTQNY